MNSQITEEQVLEYLASLGSSYQIEKVVKKAFEPFGIDFTTWSYEDIQSWAEQCGREVPDKDKAFEILQGIVENHDATIGINWDVIDSALDSVPYDEGDEIEEDEEEIDEDERYKFITGIDRTK